MLAKVNQMEILLVTPEGLRPVKQFTINGRVQVSIINIGDVLGERARVLAYEI